MRKTPFSVTSILLAGLVMPAVAMAADGGTKTIDLVFHSLQLAAYFTKDGKEECPHGFNVRNDENLRASLGSEAAFEDFVRKTIQLGPNGQTYPEAYLLMRGPQGQNVASNPEAVKDPIPQAIVEGKIGYGLNLDGKIGPNDFTSPEGEQGIDNQMYRALGCMVAWREGGALQTLFKVLFRESPGDRLLARITGVHDERNDDHVEVFFYKGADSIPLDAGGKPIVNAIQRVDVRYTRPGTYLSRFTSHTSGRIVDGVLYTDPVDHHILWSDFAFGERFIRGMRLRLKLTPTGATGLLGGYESVREFYLTHALKLACCADGNGHWSPPGFYEALNRLADGYPDPKTGRNTAISTAYEVEATRVMIAVPKDDDTDVEMEAASRSITRETKRYARRDSSAGPAMSASKK